MVQGFETKELCFHMHDNYKVMIHIIVYATHDYVPLFSNVVNPYLHNL